MGELENLRAEVESLKVNLLQVQEMTIDHAQRFDTLQTPFYKRAWYWLDGWPWRDLNGERRWRPWHEKQSPPPKPCGCDDG